MPILPYPMFDRTMRKNQRKFVKFAEFSAKKLLTFPTPCVRMVLPVKKGSFFAAIFQPRAGIVVARFLNFY